MGLFDFFKKKKEPKFKIGETVVCIDDRDHAVTFRQEYIIIDICQCNCKGNRYAYDIGLTSHTLTHCYICKTDLPGRNIQWAGEFRFKKKEAGKFKYGNFIYSKPKKKC